MGSAKGWAANILFNPTIRDQFTQFYARPDTFSLGVCNGCQLMGLIGWIGTPPTEANAKPDILLDHNLSKRFECRWSNVKIESSNAIMLKDMEGSTFGVWVAHGEGRFTFKDDTIYKNLVKNHCTPIRYVGDDGLATEEYPMNPNGSVDGLAAVCSADGRHLAMMPHPERCVEFYQWPYVPPEWNIYQKSPWLKMFKNAYEWCSQVKFHQVYY